MERVMNRQAKLGIAAFALASAVAVAGSPVEATIIFDPGNHPQPDEVNILFTAPDTGMTITGEVDHTGIAVNFSTLTGETLLQKAQGQADIFNAAVDAHNKNLDLTSMDVTIPGFGFNDFILNLQNGTGTALVTAKDNVNGTFTYMLGNGQNFLTIHTDTAGEFLTEVSVVNASTTTPPAAFGFSDFKQPRVSGVCTLTDNGCTPVPTPEPSTLTLLGAGLVGLGLTLRRRREAKPTAA
jgi:hypothetical protein